MMNAIIFLSCKPLLFVWNPKPVGKEPEKVNPQYRRTWYKFCKNITMEQVYIKLDTPIQSNGAHQPASQAERHG